MKESCKCPCTCNDVGGWKRPVINNCIHCNPNSQSNQEPMTMEIEIRKLLWLKGKIENMRYLTYAGLTQKQKSANGAYNRVLNLINKEVSILNSQP